MHQQVLSSATATANALRKTVSTGLGPAGAEALRAALLAAASGAAGGAALGPVPAPSSLPLALSAGAGPASAAGAGPTSPPSQQQEQLAAARAMLQALVLREALSPLLAPSPALSALLPLPLPPAQQPQPQQHLSAEQEVAERWLATVKALRTFQRRGGSGGGGAQKQLQQQQQQANPAAAADPLAAIGAALVAYRADIRRGIARSVSAILSGSSSGGRGAFGGGTAVPHEAALLLLSSGDLAAPVLPAAVEEAVGPLAEACLGLLSLARGHGYSVVPVLERRAF